MKLGENMLTSAAGSGYAFLVTAKSVTGFDSPIRRRTPRPSLFGGFFVSGAWFSSFGRAMRGASRLAGSYDRSVNPHGSALFAFDSAWAEISRGVRKGYTPCNLCVGATL